LANCERHRRSGAGTKVKKLQIPFRNAQTYIIPTKFGFIFFLVFALMLVVGAVYANNMVFMMAFALFGLGNIAMLQTHKNINSLIVESAHVSSGFAGDKVPVIIRVKNRKKNNFIVVEFRVLDQTIEALQIEANTNSIIQGSFLLAKRGHYTGQRVRVQTVFPYGLFVAWQWHHVNIDFYVYPKPVGQQEPLFQQGGNGEDFSGHRDFREGDSLRHVNWKSFAKGRPKLVKEFKDGNPHASIYTLEQVEGDDLERRLSQLTKWITDAFDNKWDFGLHLRNKTIAVGTGKEHLHRCLKELATHEAA
jgi:uncharacterized protein (DUF58 family)